MTIGTARVWLGSAFVRIGLRLAGFHVEERRKSVPPPRQPMMEEEDDLSPMGVTLNETARKMVEDGRTPEPEHVEVKEPLLEGSLAHRIARQRGEV